MPIYCPKCENEILPYLKSGELKAIDYDIDTQQEKLISYQLYYCIQCKTAYYVELYKDDFVNLETARLLKESENNLKKGGENGRG